MKTKNYISRILISTVATLLLIAPFSAQALNVTSRSTTLGNSAANAVTSYVFSFKPGTSGNIGAIKLQICDSPLETATCVNSGSSSGASLTSNSASFTGQSGISGFSTGSGTPPGPSTNAFWITNGTPQNISSATTVTITLSNVHNPSANGEFYTRITTYSNSNGSTEVDYGAMAVATANQITVTGTMPESLVFCVGTSGTTCGNITGTAVDLGVFSPASTSTGSSVMSASTNAGFGYAITLNGTTMTSGANTITAMTGTAAAAGTSQYGVNLRGNTSPSVGADSSGTGSGAAASGYNTQNQFKFNSGDTVGSASGPTDTNLFTASYIVNVSGAQPAGLYTAIMTYICTATF